MLMCVSLHVYLLERKKDFIFELSELEKRNEEDSKLEPNFFQSVKGHMAASPRNDSRAVYPD